MKIGDLVKRKNSESKSKEVGLFMGTRTFRAHGDAPDAPDYTCAQVMWSASRPPNGDEISTIQLCLIEVINESR